MNKIINFLLFILLFGVSTFGQTTTPPPTTTPAPTTVLLSMGSQIMGIHINGNGTTPGTDAYGEFSFTDHWVGRTDNLLATAPCLNCGAGSLQGYFGRVKFKSSLDTIFGKTNIPKKAFEGYLAAGPGVVRIVPPTGATKQKLSALVGGGLNYDPTSSGKFTINLINIDYLNAPIGPRPHNFTYSIGLKIGLWSTKTQ
jgi:hypothetical protein